MIKGVTITNHLNESIFLELSQPEDSGFIVKKIDGLGPVKAGINVTELATSDGGIFNSSRLQKRNIVFYLEFLQHPTIEATRLLSYKYFPIGKNIEITVETDARICKAYGYVESNEPTIFSKNEGCQVSVLCPDPYFRSIEINKIRMGGVDPLFEFPFSNESLDKKLLEMGKILDETDKNVYYDGEIEIGVVMKIHATGPVENLRIYCSKTRDVIRINDAKIRAIVGSGISAGDDIILSTVRNEKSIIMARGGKKFNIINALEKPISWFKLSKGDNIFAYATTTDPTNLEIMIENEVLYEGV